MLILLKKFHLKIRVFYFKDVKLIAEKFNYKPNSMKKIVLPIVLFLSVCSYSQFITVNEGYTTRELIEDILINDICTTASNFGSRTGSDYGQGNGIGAFSANGSDFPYQNGIILSSGFVSNAPGPNSNAILADGDPSWPGDVDLDAYTNVSESLNASFIQFDFVPSISSISFNFIFASEEYNQVFECVYSDAFAFILTDQATGIVRNLAVLPGSETPIECTNVHPSVPGACAAINEIYFDKYNFAPFNNSNFSATAFNGQMTSLSAQGNVIPGNLYTIKLVVGDDGIGIDDAVYDPAVSAEVVVSEQPALDPGTDGVLTICEGEVVTSAELFSSLGGSPDGGGLWSPLPLAGADIYTYTHASVGACPAVSAEVVVSEQPALDSGTDGALSICEGDTVTEAELFSSLGGTPSAGGLWSPFPLAGADTYTYTHGSVGECPGVSAEVVVSEQPALDPGTDGVLTICEGEVVTSAELFSSLGGTPSAGGLWSPFPLAGADTYTYTHGSVGGCPGVSAEVVVSEQPALDSGTDGVLSICEGDTVIEAELFSSLGGTPSAGGLWSPFPLAGADTYTYTHLAVGECPGVSAEVVVSEQPALDPGTDGVLTICEGEVVTSAELFSSLGGTPSAGGLWSPFPLAGADTYTYTHLAVGVCPGVSAEVVVSEQPSLDPGTDGALSICEGDTVIEAELFSSLGGTPSAGGLWSPFPLAGADTYTYTHGSVGACPAVSAEVVVSEQPALDPGTDGVLTICEGEVVTSAELFSSLGGSPDGGGLWSPLPLAGAGTYTYTHLAVGLCPGVSAVVEVDAQTAPPIFPPPVLEYCDPDNDGFGSFTLTDADTYVLGGNTTVTLEVSYHYTPDDAQNGVNKIEDSPYFNDVQNTQLVYVRLYDTSSGCYSTTTLELSVLSSPQITHPDDLFPLVQCDDAIFDLTQSEQFIITPHTDYVFTYYSDVALQILIPSPTAYTSILPNPQTIYIVVGYPPTGGVNNDCTSQTSLNLIVNTPPLLSPPDPYKLCDGTGLLGSAEEAFFDLESQSEYITGDPSVLITYHETQNLANSGTNALESPYTNTSNPQTIFIRAVSEDTQCVVTQGITLDLVVNPLPSPLTPTALEVCDIDNDGFASFTLTDKNIEIIGGEPGVLLTYHETLLDAQVGNYALTSPYINIVTPSQIIYVRAVYPLPPLGTGTGCFETVQLELIVNPTPIIPFNIEDLVVCDDDRDGVSIFDLTDKEDIIYGTQSPADFTLTYYLTQEHATNGTPRIANPTVFENTINPQTIWVRLEHNFTECFKIGKFNIFSQSGPSVVQPLEPLTECDDLGDPNDGVTLFDLTLMNDVITDGVSGVTVEYYTDPDLYFSIMNPTAYENLTNPQNIYTRVTNVNTSCFNTSIYLTLRVAANPDPEDPDPIILCDVNNPGDMKEVFDLTNREVQILDGETWNLSYYNSYQDAIDNNDMIAIPTIYTNVTSPEIVYVRVSIDISDVTACFEIVELELIVNPLPDATAVISPYIICEVPSDGEAVFDLSTKIGEILNGQDPFIFEVLFYENQADADFMINAIQNPTTYSNLVNPQTIYVVILNGTTACFVATQSFDIEEQEGAVANPPDPHAICDNLDENDGIAEFDLLNQDLLDEILGAQNSSVYQLDFYGTLDNATLGVSPLPVTYINIINPQIIYARVTNTNTVCYDITQVILKVELIPELVLDDVYTLCVDALGNSIPEVAGNISLPVIDTGLNPSIYMFEWQLNSEVLWGEIGASITVLQEGTYMVIVTEILTGCMSSATTTVVTSSPPLNYSVEVTDAFASEHTITATANGIGDYEFQLDGNPFQGSGVFLDVAPGNHLVTIKDVNGCGSVTITVIVIDYPQFMTPNQDGYHDTWNIIGISDGDPTAKIYIFDRHGKLLKQLSTFSTGWDGSYNGNPMPSNDYWFRVEYTENNTKKEFSGHFTLKR